MKAVFWLLAGKILHDKAVPGFIRLNLTDVDKVYSCWRGITTADLLDRCLSAAKRTTGVEAAAKPDQEFGHCGCVSTEVLAYLYEIALIDKVTRSNLGTHSTPTWLVDYIVGRLRPWIEDLPRISGGYSSPLAGTPVS